MAITLIGELLQQPYDGQAIPTTIPSSFAKKPIDHLYVETLPPSKFFNRCNKDCQSIITLALVTVGNDLIRWGLPIPSRLDGIGSAYLHSFLPNGPNGRLVPNLQSLDNLPPLEKKMMDLLPPHTIHSSEDILRLINDDGYLTLLSNIMLSYLNEYPTDGNTGVMVGAYHVKHFVKARNDIQGVYGIYASYSLLDYLHQQGLPKDTPARILNGDQVLFQLTLHHLHAALKEELPLPYKVYVFLPTVETPSETRGLTVGPFSSEDSLTF